MVLCVCLLTACGRTDVRKSAGQILPQAAGDKYDPPADRKITDMQVKMYLVVRRRELEMIRGAAGRLVARSKNSKSGGGKSLDVAGRMGALDDAAALLQADMRAAAERGYSAAEYQWVKDRVLEATAAIARSDFDQSTAETARQSMRYYRRQLAGAATDAERQMWQQNIEALEKQEAELSRHAEEADSVTHNREIVRRYHRELEIVASAGGKEAVKQETERH